MIVRMIVQTIVFLAVIGAVLFVSAGTVAWPAAWIYLFLNGVASLWIGLWLARADPELLAERMGSIVSREQSRWDQIFMVCIMIGYFAWLCLIGIDAMRLRWSRVPLWLSAFGGAAIVLDFYLTSLVFRANRFAAPVVKIQRERGHAVIDTGPYALVRHPMYGAAILVFVGTPLLLGSWWGLACVPLMVAGLGYRAVNEERALADGLPGYREYLGRVRYRFVPGVW